MTAAQQVSYLTPVGWWIVGGALALFLAFWFGVEVGQYLQRNFDRENTRSAARRARDRATRDLERRPW